MIVRMDGFFFRWRLPLLGERYTQLGEIFVRLDLWSKTPTTRTGGLCSRCADHSHVLMFDYDHATRSFVKEDVEFLANAWSYPAGFDSNALRFGRSYLFENAPKSYIAICPDKFPMSLAYAVLQHSSCDFAFRQAGRRISETRTWVVRTEPKGKRRAPRYVGHLDPVETSGRAVHRWGRNKSLFHMLYIHKMMGVPFNDIIWHPNDGITLGTVVKYNTATRVEMAGMVQVEEQQLVLDGDEAEKRVVLGRGDGE